MSVSLAAILSRVRAVVAAVVPTTDKADRFVLVGRDLGLDVSPDTQHRAFEVVPLGVPTMTRTMAGISSAQFAGGFAVQVRYDAGADRPDAEALALEDAESLTFAIELDPSYPAGTRAVERRGAGQFGFDEAGFAILRLEFAATYERTF